MQSSRNTWWGAVAKAAVRHRQRQAVTSSNVVQRMLRSGWRRERRAEISAGPKKNERWTRFLSGMGSLASGKGSYSRWTWVTRGGSRALRRCRSQTGRMEGRWAPRASSPMADVNWKRPVPSNMVWLKRRAKMKPPHLRRHWSVKPGQTHSFTEERVLRLLSPANKGDPPSIGQLACLPEVEYQRTTDDSARAWGIVKQLFKAIERRLRADSKLLKRHVSISLDEQSSFTSALHHQFPAAELSQPPCQWVIVNQRP
ncbi:RNA-binding KH domain-containing protein [Striga asiatica]|uniref:RNA-binding KH domain-containing protein n=1 Tax=Striga asiatica TaxID=4170 RepID=A0A5A7P3E0_STRAF|nr:RNA-binding KH domain-containing protein [Striga asiatica]